MTQTLHDEPHALSIALVDQSDFDELEKEARESEARAAELEHATTDAARALKRICRELDDIGIEDTLTDADRKAFETLTTQIEDIAEALERV